MASLKELLQDELKQDVYIENDANCFALAEATWSRTRLQGYVRVILGTGCGAGIVVDRKIYDGINRLLVNLSPMSFENGRLCWCGRRGCVETYGSGSV